MINTPVYVAQVGLIVAWRRIPDPPQVAAEICIPVLARGDGI